MNQDTLANLLSNLGRQDFESVVARLLELEFGLKVIKVDRSGDGGSDYLLLHNSGGAITAAFQQTTQKDDWQSKALEDATKAVDQLAATRFFFLTNRSHRPRDMRRVENDIHTQLGIPATCLGAAEIASLAFDANIVEPILTAAGVPVVVDRSNRPDSREMLLHAFVALGDEASDLRAQVLDDAILVALREAATPLTMQEVIDSAKDLIGADDSKLSPLRRRVDSLLGRGLLTSDAGQLSLSPGANEALGQAERVYDKEFVDFATAARNVVSEQAGELLTDDMARLLAFLLARAFVQAQLQTLHDVSLGRTTGRLLQSDPDPLQRMRDELRPLMSLKAIETTIDELIEIAKENPLVKKLARSATLLALDGSRAVAAAKSLGLSSWRDAKVLLDTSVAIPYLCARHFEPSTRRFSVGANAGVRIVQRLGANVRIPAVYLNECSAHLIRAMSYDGLDRFAEDLAFSPNGFVSHYYTLRRMNRRVPSSLAEYLHAISAAVARPDSDWGRWVRTVQATLQPLFRKYDIDFEYMDDIPEHYIRRIEVAYDFQLKQSGVTKPKALVDHDVRTIAHVVRGASERDDRMVCLTWDRAMIAVGREIQECPWIVAPQTMADLCIADLPSDQTQLCSLAHSLARRRDRDLELGARVIDRIVSLAGERMQEWEFQNRVELLKQRVLALAAEQVDTINQILERETAAFIKNEGISMNRVPELAADDASE